MSVHKGEEILSEVQKWRSRPNECPLPKLDKRWPTASVCLTFALAREEKKENKAQLSLHTAKEDHCCAMEYIGLVSSKRNKGQCDHTRTEGLMFHTTRKWQLATKTKGMENGKSCEVPPIDITFFDELMPPLWKSVSFCRNGNANIPEKQCPWVKINLSLDAEQFKY